MEKKKQPNSGIKGAEKMMDFKRITTFSSQNVFE